MNLDVGSWPPKSRLSWGAWLLLLMLAPLVGAASGLLGVKANGRS